MKQWSMILVFLFLVIHFVLGLKAIQTFAPTYDEPVHLTAGYVYFTTGDYRYNGYHHPAFGEMWAAIPLLFLNPLIPRFHPAWVAAKWSPYEQYQFARAFLYQNRIDHEKMMQLGQVMQLLLSLLLGFFLFLAGTKLRNEETGFLAMGLWAFSPTFLAHGTVVATDLPFVVFLFGFFVGLQFAKSKLGFVLTGVSLGLCLASKYLSIALGPISMALLVWWFFRRELPRPAGTDWKNLSLIGGVALLVVLIIYNKQFGVYWEGLVRIIGRSQAGRSAFFMGEHGVTGWLHYFPMTILLKSPIALLVGLGVGAVVFVRKKLTYPVLFWLPPVLFFGLACLSKVQIGHRHILVLYPFMFLFAAYALSHLKGKFRWTGAVLVLGVALSTLGVRPHYLAYFNEVFGGPSKGYTYLTDSNIDWGQGLKPLARELTEEDRERGIFLCYFGTADPHAYGIKYLNIGSDPIMGYRDDRDRPGISPTKFAISITNLQATYYKDKKIFAWLKEYEPEKVIAHSIFLYDFKDNPEALGRLFLTGGFKI